MLVYEKLYALGSCVTVQLPAMKRKMGKCKHICRNLEQIYHLLMSTNNLKTKLSTETI